VEGLIILGLITEEVEILWERPTCSHYKQLGYVFTGIKSKLIVRVTDLTLHSNVKIDVKCDNCNKINNMQYGKYKKQLRDEKYYCGKCVNKIFSSKSINKTLLLKSVSFSQWCITNNKKEIVDRWDYELNHYKPEEICYGSRKKFFFKCPKEVHKSELCNVGDFTNGHNGVLNCRACNSFAQWGINNFGENFLDKYWDYAKNVIDPWELSHGSRSSSIWIKCQEKSYHESYLVLANNFVSGTKCPYCCNHRGMFHF